MQEKYDKAVSVINNYGWMISTACNYSGISIQEFNRIEKIRGDNLNGVRKQASKKLDRFWLNTRAV